MADEANGTTLFSGEPLCWWRNRAAVYREHWDWRRESRAGNSKPLRAVTPQTSAIFPGEYALDVMRTSPASALSCEILVPSIVKGSQARFASTFFGPARAAGLHKRATRAQ